MFVSGAERLNRLAARAATAVVASAVIAGCAAQKVETLPVDVQPAATAAVSTSVFRPALACLDKMLAQRRPATTDIVVGAMPDATGELPIALRDMTMNAIGKANTRSGAFRVIDLPLPNPGVLLSGGGAMPFPSSERPNLEPTSLHLTGSIVALGRSLYSEGADIGAGTSAGRIGLSYVSQLSSVTTGMRLSRFGTREQLYNEQRQMVIRDKQRGADLVAEIGDFAIGGGISFDEREAPATAVQTLVDLHVIELLGKASGVPYWDCLNRPSTDPSVNADLSSTWRNLSGEERVARIQSGLKALGYPGSLAGALTQFQIDNGLVITGRPDFDSFVALSLASPSGVLSGPDTPVASAANGLALRVNNIGPTHRMEIGLLRSAHVACFHQAEDGAISRVLPNPFQRDGFLSANTTHFVPNTIAEKSFFIRGRNLTFLCAAAAEPIGGRLPAAYQAPAFADLRANGVTSLTQLQADIERTAGDGVVFALATSP